MMSNASSSANNRLEQEETNFKVLTIFQIRDKDKFSLQR